MVQVCGIELIPNYNLFGHIILRILVVYGNHLKEKVEDLLLESKSTNEDSNEYLKQE